MELITQYNLEISIASATVGLLALSAYFFLRRQTGASSTQPHGVIEHMCSVCHHALVFHRNDLIRLSPAEIAMVVSARPRAQGRSLAELVCSYCSSSHCFATESKTLDWIGVNLYSPQTKSSNCAECHARLKRPPWREGDRDGVIYADTELDGALGVKCKWCKAAVCVSCCKRLTKNRTPDRSLLCPRCFRGPIDTFFHP